MRQADAKNRSFGGRVISNGNTFQPSFTYKLIRRSFGKTAKVRSKRKLLEDPVDPQENESASPKTVVECNEEIQVHPGFVWLDTIPWGGGG